jgi:hypothetical protein
MIGIVFDEGVLGGRGHFGSRKFSDQAGVRNARATS